MSKTGKKLVIEVCAGSDCVMMGSMDIIESIDGLKSLKSQLRLQKQIEIVPVKCMGYCKNGACAPVVKVDDEVIQNATSETVMSYIISQMASNK